jgi:hypothetical protein
VLEIMDETQLTNSLTKEEAIRTALGMSAYFEDVISQLNIWKSFINEHKRLYGKYLPFYQVDDHYYDDEVNLEDTTFLVWHFLQQLRGFRKGTFLSPDNDTTLLTARKIYDLFCKEWTEAPENERMKDYLSDAHRLEDDKEIANLAAWFHFDSYLFPMARFEFSEMAKEAIQDSRNGLNAENMMAAFDFQAENEPTLLLGYTAMKWLSLIIPETHPDYDKIKAFVDNNDSKDDEQNAKITETAAEEFEKFEQASEGKPLLYFTSSEDLKKFIKENIGEKQEWTNLDLPESTALGATKECGLELIFHDLDCIKDEANPFYKQESAEKNSLSYFVVPHLTPSLLGKLEANGMLDDATAHSLVSKERGKAIVHDNWDFLQRYFIRQYNS